MAQWFRWHARRVSHRHGFTLVLLVASAAMISAGVILWGIVAAAAFVLSVIAPR